MFQHSKYVKTLGMAAAGLALSFMVVGPVAAEGNRPGWDRDYNSEISAAKAYLLITSNKGSKDIPAALIDVRTLGEHAAGHPKGSYNVPFPHINWASEGSPYVGQDPQVFYDEVLLAVDGNLDTPIMTLCRSGYRSVLAANILANPAGNGVYGEPFTNVRNIWEGFQGAHRYDNNDIAVDMTGDGEVTELDKDGWINHMELPYSTVLTPARAYLNDVNQYETATPYTYPEH